jgi:tetratricopeptide (TPR) repeat protein
MLRELTEALDAVTTEYPLVLVLEDLHWSDRATLEWLAYVTRRPDPARLLLLGTYRPVDAMVQAHPLRTVLTELQQHGQCAELALDYLSEGEVTAYLHQRFGGARLAADLAHMLYQRTQGNPLFLIAMVDGLVRQQVVREGPEGWVLQGRVETISTIVPASLRAMIEQQLVRCSLEERTLLEAASVAGAEFAVAAVAAGLERADDEIEAQCATLAHHGQFLQARGCAEWPDGTVTSCFGFRHALYHDILYQRIPAGRQTRWHARIGARLAQGFGAQAGDLAAVLAMHFVRGRILSQAVPYLRQAGEKAMARSAHREAVGYFEQALGALQHLPENRDTIEQAIDLRFDLRNALFVLAEHQRIFAYLREAETLAQALGDQRRLGWVFSYMVRGFYAVSDYDRTIASGERALAIAAALEDVGLQTATRSLLGQAHCFLGDYRRAVDLLRRNVASLKGKLLHEHFGLHVPASVYSYTWLVASLAELGAFAEGIACSEEVVWIAESVNQPGSVISASFSTGLLYLRKGDFHKAIAMLARGLELSQVWDFRTWATLTASHLGYAYALSGRVAEAVPLLEQTVGMNFSASGRNTNRITYLSEAYLLAGRRDEAIQLAGRALELARQYNELSNQAWILRLLGNIHSQGDPPDVELAETSYRQALALADELGMRPLCAHCHFGLGILHVKTAQRVQARAELSAAITLYRAMDMTLWLPQAEAALVQVEDDDRL